MSPGWMITGRTGLARVTGGRCQRNSHLRLQGRLGRCCGGQGRPAGSCRPAAETRGAAHRRGTHFWDDGSALRPVAMYTDWTAVILLLLTAAPLAVVVATAAFFILRQKRSRRF